MSFGGQHFRAVLTGVVLGIGAAGGGDNGGSVSALQFFSLQKIGYNGARFYFFWINPDKDSFVFIVFSCVRSVLYFVMTVLHAPCF